MNRKMVYKVFFSYPQGRNWDIWPIKYAVEENDAEVFLDVANIGYGENIEDVIIKNLNDSDELWLFVAKSGKELERDELIKDTTERPYVWLEVGVALDRDIPVVPILINLTKRQLNEDEDIPLCIKQKKAVELKNPIEFQNLINSTKEKAKKRKRQKYRVKRKSIKLPIVAKCYNNDFFCNATVIELSDDGRGCFIEPTYLCEMQSNSQVINCSFNVEIVHKGWVKRDISDIHGIGGKICPNHQKESMIDKFIRLFQMLWTKRKTNKT